MTLGAIAVLAFSMSADACAAAIARGASTRPNFRSALKGGLVFGSVEAVTPLLGWAIGLVASRFIAAVDHWVAFVLLGIVGGKMALESIRRLGQAEELADEAPIRAGLLTLVLTAFATSAASSSCGKVSGT